MVREDPNRKGFLVLGTDTGLFFSNDDGAHWTVLKSNFPTVPIYDIKFVKQNHDLVVATHGRGLFVLDDITALEESGGEFCPERVPSLPHCSGCELALLEQAWLCFRWICCSQPAHRVRHYLLPAC